MTSTEPKLVEVTSPRKGGNAIGRYVAGLLNDSSNTLWVAFGDAKVFARPKSQADWKEVNLPPNVRTEHACCLAEDARKRVWLGTDAGPVLIKK